MKRISVFILLFTSLLLILSIGIESVESALAPITLVTSSTENVTVYFLDVGQGDSILIKTPSKNILIDGGPTSAGSTLLNDLNSYQVANIDLMVATHPHADHIGGLISVLQSTITVQDIIYNGYNYTSTQTFNTWKNLALAHNLTQANRGQIYALSPTIDFTVLSPTSPTQFDDINAESIVMSLRVGNISVMFTGDAQLDTEQFLVSSGSNLSCQILKVGHHGSSTSTSQAFLTSVAPNYGIISAGLDNSYGHPTQQTLDILSTNNVITYGTYESGNIIFSLNPAGTEPSPSPTTSPSPSPSPSTSPTASPTPSPTPIAPPTQSPTSNPTAAPTSSPTNKPTPAVPELPYFIVVPLLMATILIGLIIQKKREINSNKN